VGPNADTSMISGGGSAQVDPPGHGATKWKEHVWFPSSPLKAIARKTPGATVEFDSGADPAYAAALAKRSDVAIVFAYQWTSEDMDLPNLSLPENQDAMIEQVAAANPQTIVVLETGTAVTMPWLNAVRGVLEAWYTGSQGADAVANILFGEVNPTAKLPMTFPRSEADLPHPQHATLPASAGEPPKRLVGWDKVHLNAGESKEVSVPVKTFYLSIYDEASDSWKLVPGTYKFMVGGSSQSLPLVENVNLK